MDSDSSPVDSDSSPVVSDSDPKDSDLVDSTTSLPLIHTFLYSRNVITSEAVFHDETATFIRPHCSSRPITGPLAYSHSWHQWYGMLWYTFDLYSAIVAKVSNALNHQPSPLD